MWEDGPGTSKVQKVYYFSPYLLLIGKENQILARKHCLQIRSYTEKFARCPRISDY